MWLVSACQHVLHPLGFFHVHCHGLKDLSLTERIQNISRANKAIILESQTPFL